VIGSPETALSLTANLVIRTGMRAISVDYRLAPEHPFPAAIEDTVAAYRALLADEVDPRSVAFAGDSAGGGLTVTTCLAARDAGLTLPAAIVAFSPGLDQTRTGAGMDTRAGIDPIFTRESLGHLSAHYLAGQPRAAVSRRDAPRLRRGALSSPRAENLPIPLGLILAAATAQSAIAALPDVVVVAAPTVNPAATPRC
jgi:acetyl esterase/lipase